MFLHGTFFLRGHMMSQQSIVTWINTPYIRMSPSSLHGEKNLTYLVIHRIKKVMSTWQPKSDQLWVSNTQLPNITSWITLHHIGFDVTSFSAILWLPFDLVASGKLSQKHLPFWCIWNNLCFVLSTRAHKWLDLPFCSRIKSQRWQTKA